MGPEGSDKRFEAVVIATKAMNHDEVDRAVVGAVIPPRGLYPVNHGCVRPNGNP